MKTLIVEDDFVSRRILQEYLKNFGPAHVAVNGDEAIEASRVALEAEEPYELICMDIMMPGIDGHEAVRAIRAMEEARGIRSNRGAKIVMTTALADMKSVSKAYSALCDAYLVKPLDRQKLLEELRKLGIE